MFPHIIKLVGSSMSLSDLKYHLENILNPLKQVPIIRGIYELNYGIYIISFNGVSGVLKSLYHNLFRETEARLVINTNRYFTITFEDECLQGIREKPWTIECPFCYVEYGLLYKGRPYINWVYENTESMEIEYAHDLRMMELSLMGQEDNIGLL
jgi:hypothetical protein